MSSAELLQPALSQPGARRVQPLGAALLVIRACRVDALSRAATSVLAGRSIGAARAAGVVEALLSVATHVGGDDGIVSAHAAVESVLEPPEGHVDGDPGWYRRAAVVLGFLLSVGGEPGTVHAAPNTAAALASLFEQSSDRRQKLRCVRVLRVLNARDVGMGVDALSMVVLLRALLADIERVHAASESPSVPSRLTVEASDCVLAWCTRPPSTSAPACEAWTAFARDAIVAVGTLTSVWHALRARLYSAAAAVVVEVASTWPANDRGGVNERVRDAALLLSSQTPERAELGRVVRRAGEALQAMAVSGPSNGGDSAVDSPSSGGSSLRGTNASEAGGGGGGGGDDVGGGGDGGGGDSTPASASTPRGLLPLWHAAMVGLAVGREEPVAALALMGTAQCGIGELLVFVADPATAQLDCSRRFATELLRMAVGGALRDGGDGGGVDATSGDAHLDALFSLARSGSVMAAACSGVLVDLVEVQPKRVLERVFAIFDGASVEEQLGMLDVVRGMVAEGVAQRLPATSQTRLADALLARLQDADVSVRNLAARVLARLDPALSVAVLCNRLIDRDDRSRSAAELALIEMLREATDATNVLHTLLSLCSSDHLTIPPAHPGQVGGGANVGTERGKSDEMTRAMDAGVGSASESDGVVKRRERILHVVKRWVDSEVDDSTTRSEHSHARDSADHHDNNDSVGDSSRVAATSPSTTSLSATSLSAAGSSVQSIRRWPTILAPFAVSLVLTKPEDSARVQLATRMAPRLALPDCLGNVLAMLLQVLREQDVLSADVLERDSSGALTKTLLFQRLSPLLLLRMLPNAAFLNVTAESATSHRIDQPNYDGSGARGGDGVGVAAMGMDGSHNKSDIAESGARDDDSSPYSLTRTLASVREVLLERVCSQLEFDDVRRVAAELLSRGSPSSVFPAVLTALSNELDALEMRSATGPRDPGVAKALVYCLCCGVAAHRGDAAIAVAKPAIFDSCVRSFRLAVPVSTTDPDASDALRKLQRGCIDLLGLCVATEVADIAAHNHQRASSRSRIVVIEEVSGDGVEPRDAAAASAGGGSGRDGILRRVLSLLCEGDPGAAPICAANALTSADQHIHQLSGEDASIATPRHAALMKQSAPTLLGVVAGSIRGSVGARAAAAHALFAMSFRLQGSNTMDEYTPQLIDVACSVLAEDATPSTGPLRLGAVKIIGVVLGRTLTAATSTNDVGHTHAHAHAVTLPGAGLARLHSVLVGVSNMEPSPEVRAVATRLLQAVGAAHPTL